MQNVMDIYQFYFAFMPLCYFLDQLNNLQPWQRKWTERSLLWTKSWIKESEMERLNIIFHGR